MSSFQLTREAFEQVAREPQTARSGLYRQFLVNSLSSSACANPEAALTTNLTHFLTWIVEESVGLGQSKQHAAGSTSPIAKIPR